jgi:hypothetical protein
MKPLLMISNTCKEKIVEVGNINLFQENQRNSKNSLILKRTTLGKKEIIF